MPRGIYIRTKEIRRKIRKALKGNQNALGAKHSEEARRKNREAHQGKSSLKKNITYEEMYGIKKAKEIRRKISKALQGNKNGFQKGNTIGLGNKHGFQKGHTVNLSRYPTEKTRRKQREAKIGKYQREKNPNWIDGRSFEPYTDEFTSELKELIRNRDGYKCQKCGCPEIENNQKLTIHHIDYNKKNCKPSNLISLCIRCNAMVNFNRSKWTKYFQRRIKKIMNSNIIQLNFRFGNSIKRKDKIRFNGVIAL